MKEQTTTESTILFADICRSTVLFDQLGDQPALDLVIETLRLCGEIATQNHGRVIGTIGDEVMCIFDTPEDALITANQIHSLMQSNNLMLQHQMAMRVGINSGAVVNSSNSVYGDTVNVAARLAAKAKANQSLVSSNTIASISENLRDQLRVVGEISLQGKAGTLKVFELLEPGKEEEITEVAVTNEVVTRAFLMTARFQTRQMRFDPMLVRFLFGRGMDCDQVIDHSTISREHAEFIYRDGQFIFQDFSTNGSLVVHGDKVEQLHRSGIELKGNGKIYLGRTLDQLQYCIEFAVHDG